MSCRTSKVVLATVYLRAVSVHIGLLCWDGRWECQVVKSSVVNHMEYVQFYETRSQERRSYSSSEYELKHLPLATSLTRIMYIWTIEVQSDNYLSQYIYIYVSAIHFGIVQNFCISVLFFSGYVIYLKRIIKFIIHGVSFIVKIPLETIWFYNLFDAVR